MQTKFQRMRWKPFEEDLLKTFLQSQRHHLIINMYKNIAVGELRFRRETKLFQEMSKAVGRTSLQCKSKMQKFERHAYIEFLRLKPTHYDIFEWLRKKRSLKMKRRRRGRAGKSDDIDDEMNAKRNKVLQEILQGWFEFEGERMEVKNYLGFEANEFLSWIKLGKDYDKKNENKMVSMMKKENTITQSKNKEKSKLLGTFPNNNFLKTKNLETPIMNLQKIHDQNFLKKIIHVPPLKVSNLPLISQTASNKRNFCIDFKISELKLTINQKNEKAIELVGKRPEPRWVRVPPPKILNCTKLKRILFSPLNLRKSTKDTCLPSEISNDELLKKNSENELSNEKNILHENSLNSDFISTPKIHIVSTSQSAKAISNKSVDMTVSQNEESSAKCEKIDSINSDFYSKSTNPLNSLFKDIIKTSDNLPKNSECRMKLMSLIQKYQTLYNESLQMC